MATNTWRSYQAAVKSLGCFRSEYGLPDIWPVPAEHLLHFIAYLSASKRSGSTARAYISAIATYHKLNNMPDNSKFFLIQKALSGMSRLTQHVDQRERQPVTVELLAEVIGALPQVCTNLYEASLFTALYTLAFFGFFRVSELVAASGTDRSNRALLLSDTLVAGDQSQMQILLRTSKTDKHGRGTRIDIQSVPKSILCPVAAMSNYLSKRPAVQGPLFIHFDHATLTKFQFQSVFKKALEATSFPVITKQYSSHSFRIGAATTAFLRGFTSEDICELGRWTSSAYKSYIRVPCLV